MLKLLLNNVFKEKLKVSLYFIITILIISSLFVVSLLPNKSYQSMSMWVNTLNNQPLTQYNTTNAVYSVNTSITDIGICIRNPNEYEINTTLDLLINSTIIEQKHFVISMKFIQEEKFTFNSSLPGYYNLSFILKNSHSNIPHNITIIVSKEGQIKTYIIPNISSNLSEEIGPMITNIIPVIHCMKKHEE